MRGWMDGSRGSDRFDRGHPSSLARSPSPFRSARRAGEAWMHGVYFIIIFFFFFFSGSTVDIRQSFLLPPRARKASQRFRIEFRMPCRSLSMTILLSTPLYYLVSSYKARRRNNIDPFHIYMREIIERELMRL